MTTQTQTKVSTLCNRIKVHCPNCAVRLCDRKLSQEGWLLHVRYSNAGKVTHISALEFFIQCRECGMLHKITADEGITESNDGTRIQG